VLSICVSWKLMFFCSFLIPFLLGASMST
jgi:hypothetical protein